MAQPPSSSGSQPSNLLHLLFSSAATSFESGAPQEPYQLPLTRDQVLRRIASVAQRLARDGFLELSVPSTTNSSAMGTQSASSGSNSKTFRKSVLVDENLQRLTRKKLIFSTDPKLSRALVLLTVSHDLVVARRTATIRELYYRFRTHRRGIQDARSRHSKAASFAAARQGLSQPDDYCDSAESSEEHRDTADSSPPPLLDLDLADRFSSEAQLNEAIELCCIVTGCSRSDLGIVAASKGSFSGAIEWCERDAIILDESTGEEERDWSNWKRGEPRSRYEIPQNHDATNLRVRSATMWSQVSVRFILLVEKNTIFHQLVQADLGHASPCLIVTGRGFPDEATKRFVRTVARQLQVPVLGLCDWNPHGIMLLLSYLDYADEVPFDLRHAGILARHVRELDVPEERFSDFTVHDDRCVQSLNANPRLLSSPELRAELETMSRLRKKLELDVLSHGNYLVTTWLPRAIEESLRGFVGTG